MPPFGVVRSSTKTRLEFRRSPSLEDEDSDLRDQKVDRPRRFGQALLRRMDTMGAAGLKPTPCKDTLQWGESSKRTNFLVQIFAEDYNANLPLYAAFITRFQYAFAILGIGWVSMKLGRLLNALKTVEGGLVNTIVTSKEMDKLLHAYSCNNCGTTFFVAYGKEWYYFPKNYKCETCGNQGRENFTDIREDIIARSDDDKFEYDSHWDYLTKADRRIWLKMAKGDEELAKQLANDDAAEKAMERQKTQEAIEASLRAEMGEDEEEEEEEGEESGESNAAVEDADVVTESVGEESAEEETTSAEETETDTSPTDLSMESEPVVQSEPVESQPKEEPAPAPTPAPEPITTSNPPDDAFDVLDMDV